MSKQQAAILNVGISVLFATLMISTRWFVESESRSMVTGLLTAVWFVPFLFLSNWKGECIQQKVKCADNNGSRR